jgi:hypothetical protein
MKKTIYGCLTGNVIVYPNRTKAIAYAKTKADKSVPFTYELEGYPDNYINILYENVKCGYVLNGIPTTSKKMCDEKGIVISTADEIRKFLNSATNIEVKGIYLSVICFVVEFTGEV